MTWEWRDKLGDYHEPTAMETTHLFHTFRMIWNNHMPKEQRVGEVRIYSFDPAIYTHAYFAEAYVNIGQELFKRLDLTAEQQDELKQMAEAANLADTSLLLNSHLPERTNVKRTNPS